MRRVTADVGYRRRRSGGTLEVNSMVNTIAELHFVRPTQLLAWRDRDNKESRGVF